MKKLLPAMALKKRKQQSIFIIHVNLKATVAYNCVYECAQLYRAVSCVVIYSYVYYFNRLAAPSTGMKLPTISVDPTAGQEAQTKAPVESRPNLVTGPFKIDTSKYAIQMCVLAS